MRAGNLMIVALAWAIPGVLSARAEKLVEVPQVKGGEVKIVRAPGGAAGRSVATSSDPAEPPVQVEMTDSNVYTPRGARLLQKVAVSSGAKGTTLKLPTSGAYSGSASVTFKSAPPMRFKVELSRLQNYDLNSLTIASGALALAVGQVTSSAATKYFDAKGRALAGPTGAAYTVTAKREGNGQVSFELRRGAGAKLGKSVSISWQNFPNNVMWEKGGFAR